ncbi:MAG TPA: UDP-3-O-(3-hydroxymyristoyl)glucosamine N-acyltransferase, partial [Methylomirabilota bacterium]|nr:UDP-3-O-(3-hydroxymyristoyl)glucosamine N-acyltransferase [Methylomirabilota bacterium]
MPLTTAEIAARIDGEVVGDPAVVIHGFAAAESARPGDLTYAENEKYFARAEQSGASAILVAGDFRSASKTLIRVPNARVGFARALPLFFPEPIFPPGVHGTAVVAASARIDPAAHIGPHCVVGERCVLGPGVVLQGGNHIGDDCCIGEGTRLYPNAVVYPGCQIGRRVRIHAGAIVGADGFGYVLDQGVHRKIPQVGNVVIHDDVEIGANSTIDRAALGSTVVGRGTKIDNLVQVGHNCVLGQHVILCGQVGLSGSTRVGNYTVLAGQAGVAGHVTIGNGVTIGAQSGVMTDIPDGGKWLGSPAVPDKEAKRSYV